MWSREQMKLSHFLASKSHDDSVMPNPFPDRSSRRYSYQFC